MDINSFVPKGAIQSLKKVTLTRTKITTKRKQVALSKQEHAFFSSNDKTHFYRMQVHVFLLLKIDTALWSKTSYVQM